MEYGLLLLRLVVGLLFAGHGAQKLFGWFGGGGPQGTAAFFASLGYRAPAAMALVAGLSELGGGLLLATGLPHAARLLPAGDRDAERDRDRRLAEGLLRRLRVRADAGDRRDRARRDRPGRDLARRRDRLGGQHHAASRWASLVLASAIVVSLITTTLGRGSADLDEIPG